MPPAIGAGGRLPGRVRLRRGAAAIALLLLLGSAKLLVAHGIIKVSSARPPGHLVAAGLLVGGAPTDADLQALAAGFRVDAVVNLTAPSVAEQAAAASLHQGYLYLAVAPNTAPTWAQLRDLAAFMYGHTSVYLHDDSGAGRAVVTAAMLLLLRGQDWSAISAEMTPEELGALCECQRRIIRWLSSALHPRGPTAGDPYPSGRAAAGNPYANPYVGARLERW